MTKQRVAIFGGTGHLGTFITDAILEKSDQLHTVLFTRKDAAAEKKELISKWQSKERVALENIVIDPDTVESWKDQLKGVDVCISAVGPSSLEWQHHLIKACKDANVQRLILSEYGFPNNIPQLDGLPLFEGRRKVLQAAKESRIEYVALYTGAFFDYIFTPLIGWDLERKKAFIFGKGSNRYACTSRKDVGKLVREVCMMETLPGNELYVAGDVKSFDEMIKIWDGMISESVTVDTVTVEELEEQMKNATSKDDPNAYRLTQIKVAIARNATEFEPVNNKNFPNIHLNTFEENLRDLLKK